MSAHASTGWSELKEQLANLNTKSAEVKWQSFRSIGQEQQVSFADNISMFTLGDGSLNDGYFEQDGHHIAATETNKLTRSLQVHMKDDDINPCDAVEQR